MAALSLGSLEEHVRSGMMANELAASSLAHLMSSQLVHGIGSPGGFQYTIIAWLSLASPWVHRRLPVAVS